VRHALFFPPFGELCEPEVVMGIAREAERNGWDGIFLWDHMIRPAGDPQEIADPWILLSAVAAATTRIRLGPMVTPLARRRPQKVARETVTLDHLSHGRLLLGVGLGVDGGGELARFGECTDETERAAVLDEALDLLFALWSGEEVTHSGHHFVAQGVRFLPTPVQAPRIPVWGATMGDRAREGPIRRAARLDGVFPVRVGVDRFRRIVEEVRELRGSLEGYDIAAEVPPDAGGVALDELVDAGATWIVRSFPARTARADVERLAGRPPAPR